MTAENILCREAEPYEADAVSLVLARAVARLKNNPKPKQVNEVPELDRKFMRTCMAAANTWTLVTDHRQTIAGFAQGYPLTDGGETATTALTERLSFLMVDPTHWGKGVGRRLLDQVIARARDADRSLLTLQTQADNERAQAMYERTGFTVAGHIQDGTSAWVEYQLYL